uniref:Odorant receptor n=1 Tax=Aulacocentrum confusum TaxID=2767324 RepID=A0A7G8Z923_9HYME|nr:olfactory receptor 4 [Aulacocentrum confusum]
MEDIKVQTRHKVVKMAIIGLRLCGIWSLESSTPNYLQHLHYLSGVFGILAILIFIGTLVGDLMMNIKDLLIITDDGCFLAGITIVLFKVYKFQTQRHKLTRLTKATHEPIDGLLKSSDFGLLTILKMNNIVENFGFSCLTLLGMILVLALIFLVPTNDGELPIRANFPFDTTTWPMHQVAFFLQMFAVAYGLMAILLIDTIGLGLMRWINVQLIILSFNYQNCNQLCKDNIFTHLKNFNNNSHNCPNEKLQICEFLPFNENEKKELQDSWLWRFTTCIKNHQRLINMVDEFNELSSSSMLVQLFCSFSMICLTAFQAALGVKDKSNLLKFMLYLGAAFSQLLYWCWYGNVLFYQRMSLLNSQWMSGWENQCLSQCSSFLIIAMIQTFRPLELKAGKFFTLTMTTFIDVIRSSYSFFVLLTSVTDISN